MSGPTPEARGQTRPCGGCTACCKTMAVDGFKPEFTVCQHAKKGRGCGVYESRPERCRGFLCLWAMGVTPEDCRPDKVGIVLVPTKDQQRVQAMEVWPGSSKGDKARVICGAIQGQMDVIVVGEGGHRVLLTVRGRPQPKGLGL